MNALLHFPNRYASRPDGIWWFDGSDTLQHRYAEGAGDMERVGSSALHHVRFAADAHDVAEVFARLAERPPYPDQWETVTLTGTTPVEYLTLARKVPSAA